MLMLIFMVNDLGNDNNDVIALFLFIIFFPVGVNIKRRTAVI